MRFLAKENVIIAIMKRADLLHDGIDIVDLSLTLLKEHKELSKFSTSLKTDIRYLREENEKLKHTLFKLRQMKFSQVSEKSKFSKEPQFFDEHDPTILIEDLEQDDEIITIPEHSRKKPGRKGLPQDLPKRTIIHDIPEEDKLCLCGCQLEKIGEDTTQQLEYIPAVVQIIEHIKFKYACKNCEETIITAKLPPQPIPRSIATPGLLAHIIVSKYRDHLPLYRQEQIWNSFGVSLPRGMLSHWMIKVGALISPLLLLLKQRLISSNYIQADETTVQVLKEPDKKPSSKSYIWLYKTGIDENGIAIYEYQPNRSGSHATNYLEDFSGFLQVDGYAGYNELAGRNNITLAACWAHARRYFVDIAKSSKNSKAMIAVNFINKLYKLEKQIKNESDAYKVKIRQEKSKPIIEKLLPFLKELYPKCPPKSNLAKAINYTLEREVPLKVFLNYGFINVDNNLAENKIRPFALGRKNWLFMNSVNGANASCNIYSLLETAKMNGLEPYNYFRYILEKIPRIKNNIELAELLPIHLKPNDIKPPAIEEALLASNDFANFSEPID